MDDVSELVRAVAEKVMGWHIVELPCGCIHWHDDNNKFTQDAQLWWPDEDPNATWQVVSRMMALGYELACNQHADGTYDVEFKGFQASVEGHRGAAIGPALEPAICEAALQAVTEPIEKGPAE